MTDYILDTHILLWHSQGSSQLSDHIVEKLGAANTNLFVSQATYWEMTIKKALGKLDFTVPIAKFYEAASENCFHILPFDIAHYTVLETLPLLHADPFDRMIIAQAICRNFTIVTQDQKFREYADYVNILWN